MQRHIHHPLLLPRRWILKGQFYVMSSFYLPPGYYFIVGLRGGLVQDEQLQGWLSVKWYLGPTSKDLH